LGLSYQYMTVLDLWYLMFTKIVTYKQVYQNCMWVEAYKYTIKSIKGSNPKSLFVCCNKSFIVVITFNCYIIIILRGREFCVDSNFQFYVSQKPKMYGELCGYPITSIIRLIFLEKIFFSCGDFGDYGDFSIFPTFPFFPTQKQNFFKMRFHCPLSLSLLQYKYLYHL